MYIMANVSITPPYAMKVRLFRSTTVHVAYARPCHRRSLLQRCSMKETTDFGLPLSLSLPPR